MNEIQNMADTGIIHSIADAIRNIDLSQYAEILNPQTWQTANLESFIVMFLILAVCYKTFHKAYKFAAWCMGLLLFIQVGYALSLSHLNDLIPLSTVFKYDIGVSIANFFAGTKIAEWILWIHDVIHAGLMVVGDKLAEWLPIIGEKADEFKNSVEIPSSTPPSV